MTDEEIIDMINREKDMYARAAHFRSLHMYANAEAWSRKASELTVEISKAHP